MYMYDPSIFCVLIVKPDSQDSKFLRILHEISGEYCKEVDHNY